MQEHQNSFVDDSTLDRLADGELSVEQQKRLLAAIEQSEDGWRRCALALLESRAWKRELRKMVDRRGPVPARANDMPHRKSEQYPFLGWMPIAASLLVGLTLGSLIPFSDDTTKSVDMAVRDSHREGVVQPQDLPQDFQRNGPHQFDLGEDQVTLLVRDAEGRDQRLVLPLLDEEAVGNQFGQVPPGRPLIPSEFRGRLQDRGWDIQSNRRFAPLFFEQDERVISMVVPVDDAYLVPYEQPVF